MGWRGFAVVTLLALGCAPSERGRELPLTSMDAAADPSGSVDTVPIADGVEFLGVLDSFTTRDGLPRNWVDEVIPLLRSDRPAAWETRAEGMRDWIRQRGSWIPFEPWQDQRLRELSQQANDAIAKRGARTDADAQRLSVGPVLRRPGLLIATVGDGDHIWIVAWLREGETWKFAHSTLRTVV